MPSDTVRAATANACRSSRRSLAHALPSAERVVEHEVVVAARVVAHAARRTRRRSRRRSTTNSTAGDGARVRRRHQPHPQELADEADEREWDEVLPAQAHHLVDAEARQRPADPDDDEDDRQILDEEDAEAERVEPRVRVEERRPSTNGRRQPPRNSSVADGADDGDVHPLDQRKQREAEARIFGVVARRPAPTRPRAGRTACGCPRPAPR